MADTPADQSPETSSASDWLKTLTNAASSIITADKNAAAARDAARAAADNAAARNNPNGQPNWLLIGGIGAAVLVLVGFLVTRK